MLSSNISQCQAQHFAPEAVEATLDDILVSGSTYFLRRASNARLSPVN
ncbi:hypothetical protein CRENPOLYSF1_170052 [Crenothrix polyspora]|uniref:Uncharacterized protein n=1 Tax=Crenothrix polyspora TaxID=360316 RepID=A0A1R4H414_9GAMM|nr:hypothetical protein CRENPOLYSF1_170052 [Crenothrix polyspora]